MNNHNNNYADFDLDFVELGAWAGSFLPRVQTYLAGADNFEEAKKIGFDLLQIRQRLAYVIDRTRRRNRLASDASKIGAVGKAIHGAEWLALKNADRFSKAFAEHLPLLDALLDPEKDCLRFKLFRQIARAEDESPEERAERLEWIGEIEAPLDEEVDEGE